MREVISQKKKFFLPLQNCKKNLHVYFTELLVPYMRKCIGELSRQATTLSGKVDQLLEYAMAEYTNLVVCLALLQRNNRDKVQHC